MSVTPLETLLAAAPTQPEEIELPGWYGGEAITVRVKRPNFYHLLARDCVPNPLIPVVQKMFVHGFDAGDVASATPEFARALLTIAGETLVEPTLTQLTEAGVELTDDQLLELLSRRMRVSRDIGQYKKEHNMPVLQTQRYEELLARRAGQAGQMGMDREFMRTVLQAIHEESIRQQMEVLGK